MRWMWWLTLVAALTASAAAPARWREASSAHFVVYSEQKPADLQRYAETLERYDAVLRLLSAAPPRPATRAARVTVFLLSDIATLRRVLGQRNTGVAGFYIPRAEVPVAFAPVADGGGGVNGANVLTSQRILLHEYAHHYMYLNAPGSYPAWYREGFAEFVGASVFGEDGSVTIGGSANHRAYGLTGGALRIADIAAGMVYANPVEADEFYARSWQLTHFLTFSPARKGQLDRYLAALAAGEPAAKASAAAFGDAGKLEREARGYMTSRTIPATRIGAGALTIPPVTVREVTDGEDAAMPVRIASWRGVTPAQAAALLPQARGLAGRFPADPAVQNIVAEAEIDADQYPQAIAAADRVLATAPGDVHALVIRGRALMEQAKAAHATDEATWKEVRRWFTAANRADRADPAPIIYYHRSFAAAGQPASANAVGGLVEAARLAPQDAGVRTVLTRHYLATGDLAQGRRLLTLASGDVHGRTLGRLAPVWAAIEANDAVGALSAYDAVLAGPAVPAKS